MKFTAYLILTALALLITPATHPLPSYPPAARFMNYSPYHTELIIKALTSTFPKMGQLKIVLEPDDLPMPRVLKEVEKGDHINIFWGPAITDISSKNVITLPYPLVKGLSGFRIMLIREGEQQRISKTFNNRDFTSTLVGQGTGWIDANILRNGGFTIINVEEYKSLFSMLSQKRFDVFPLGADMIHWHYEQSKELGYKIRIEEENIIYYPMPILLYVSAKHPELAKRIRYGMEKIIKNGTMDEIFNRHYGDLVKRLKIKQRNIHFFNNPFIMPSTLPHQKGLWLRDDIAEHYRHKP
jgi:hypothetical protein